MASDPDRRPNAVPWPPIILAGLIVIALAAGPLLPPLPSDLASAVWPLGVAVAGAGLALDLWAIATLYRHRTTVLPHRGADRLVTSGPFALSRNPIYLGNTLLLLGAAGIFANLVFLPAALLNLMLVDRLAIAREEAHLASRFGDAWRDYAARVPRWIGMRRRGGGNDRER
ncbi:MAG: isoprenylcysteine carboxylmethyltransferase family protein [Pseudomonadota bacterium]